MTKQINPQPPSFSIVDARGRPTIEFFTLIEQLTRLEILDGDGTPNGTVLAQEKVLYWDRATNDVYLKTTGPEDSTGWVQISP